MWWKKMMIVNEQTGPIMDGRPFNSQAIEVKKIKIEAFSLATLLQIAAHKLWAMTGTTASRKFWEMECSRIPIMTGIKMI